MGNIGSHCPGGESGHSGELIAESLLVAVGNWVKLLEFAAEKP